MAPKRRNKVTSGNQNPVISLRVEARYLARGYTALTNLGMQPTSLGEIVRTSLLVFIKGIYGQEGLDDPINQREIDLINLFQNKKSLTEKLTQALEDLPSEEIKISTLLEDSTDHINKEELLALMAQRAEEENRKEEDLFGLPEGLDLVEE